MTLRNNDVGAASAWRLSTIGLGGRLVVIFGWGRRTFHHAGPVLYQWCRNCSNTNWFYLVQVRRWLTLFFIPVIPYERLHMLICPVCNRGVNLSGAELQWAKSMNQLAVLYTTNAISGDEYMRRLRESGAPSAAVAASPPPLRTQAPVPASDGFGGIQVMSPPPAGAPPMPSTPPPFRGTPMGRRAHVVRVVMPILAIALVAGIWIYTDQTNNSTTVPQGTIATTFVAGTCIDGTPTSSSITFASCTGDYDGKIVEVLNASETVCAYGVRSSSQRRQIPTSASTTTTTTPEVASSWSGETHGRSQNDAGRLTARQALQSVFQSRETFRPARCFVHRAQELDARRIPDQVEILMHVGQPLPGATLISRREQNLHPHSP